MVKKLLLQSNRRAVLDFIRNHEDVTISEIARSICISIPTAKKILEEFIIKNIVREVGKGHSTSEGGKKPLLYRMNDEYGYVIALHVGPDFIYAIALDVRMRIIDSYHEQLTESHTDHQIVTKLVHIASHFLASAWAEERILLNVVIALPGIADSSRGTSIYSPHYPQWQEDFPFVVEFTNRFNRRIPVYIDCVNRLQAVGEAVLGKGQHIDNFIIVDAMEEGVGAGIISDGIVTHGFNHLAGEIGHNIVDPNGPRCICGGIGCFEAMVSVKHIQHMMKQGRTTHPDSKLYKQKSDSGTHLGNLFSCAKEGDPFAIMLMDTLAEWFARGLNSIVLAIDPKLIIIQGIFVDAGVKFLKTVEKKLSELSLARVKRDLTIVYSDFSIERGALGAGCFGMIRFFEDEGIYE